MYQVIVLQQGKSIRIEQVKADTALAAIDKVEQDYPAESIVLNGKRFVWRGVDFQARRLTDDQS